MINITKCCNASVSNTKGIIKNLICNCCKKHIQKNDIKKIDCNPYSIVDDILQERENQRDIINEYLDGAATCNQCGGHMSVKFATNVKDRFFYMCTEATCPNYAIMCAREEDMPR